MEIILVSTKQFSTEKFQVESNSTTTRQGSQYRPSVFYGWYFAVSQIRGVAPRIKLHYVYWIVHHLDSWVKRDQLDATYFIITLFSAQHVSDVNTSILRSLRLIRWVTSWVVSGSMCVGVTLQFGYGGVVSVCRMKHYSYASACIRIPHHHSHTAT